MSLVPNNDTICALATPPGVSAIAMVRLSGPEAFSIADKVFVAKDGGALAEGQPNTIHYGNIIENDTAIDEVMASIFRNPHSYTGEDTIEISCHGSPYIQDQLLQVLIRAGACMAKPGEFTQRAFLNGKMDLSRAEAVADLIESNSASSHRLAMQHIKGGFAKDIQALREQLVNFASLVELELDFSEEDVEFANRDELTRLLNKISTSLEALTDSFSIGNVIKNGVPVTIAGAPNVGKSTLMNALLNEDRAIVSEIPGTTRDYLEDNLIIDGMLFRFADTAGIRKAGDSIEQQGISKTMEKMEQSQLILYLFDAGNEDKASVLRALQDINKAGNTTVIAVLNKMDLNPGDEVRTRFDGLENAVFISAKNSENIDGLKQVLVGLAAYKDLDSNQTVVTNARHYEALSRSLSAVQEVAASIEAQIGTELLAQHIKAALAHLGEITGEVTNDEILGNIFSRFCIGK